MCYVILRVFFLLVCKSNGGVATNSMSQSPGFQAAVSQDSGTAASISQFLAGAITGVPAAQYSFKLGSRRAILLQGGLHDVTRDLFAKRGLIDAG